MNRVGITIGDINGIGPELLIKARTQIREIFSDSEIIIFGTRNALDYYWMNMGISGNLDDELLKYSRLIEPDEFQNYTPEPGIVTKEAGNIAWKSILKCTDMIKKNKLDAMINLPINKLSLKKAGCNFTGHTTILINEFRKDIVMSFLSEKLNVVLITIHIPISSVPKVISKEDIINKVLTVNKFYEKRKHKIRYLILGLNPHSGEDQIFGKEENKIIKPAVQALKEKGLDISGPVPPDSAFSEINRKQFDIFVCMYHDQGLIPVKTLDFFKSCQVSIGLDFLRISVSHGTGFDIAGKNSANPESFIYALEKTKELLI